MVKAASEQPGDRKTKQQQRAIVLSSLIAAVMAPLTAQIAHAADENWTGTTGNWVDTTWSPDSAAPGATTGTTNADTATFNSAGGTITVDANRNIKNISFDGNNSAYILSGGNLLLSANGLIQTVNGGTNHTDTVNTAITLEGNYTFGGNSSTAGRGLTFGTLATITSAATSGVTTLTLNGTTTAANNLLSGNISNGTGTNTVAISKSGAGTWTLSGANTFSGGTALSAGTLLIGNDAGVGTGTLTLGGGTFGATGATRSVSNAVVVTASTTTTLQGDAFLNFNGKLSGSGTLNIGSGGFAFGNTAVNSSTSSTSGGFTGTLSVGATMGFNSPNTGNGADYSGCHECNLRCGRRPHHVAAGNARKSADGDPRKRAKRAGCGVNVVCLSGKSSKRTT